MITRIDAAGLAACVPLMVDADGAGRLLSLHPETVRRMARDGELPCVRAGRAVRFSVRSLEAWVAEQSRATANHEKSIP